MIVKKIENLSIEVTIFCGETLFDAVILLEPNDQKKIFLKNTSLQPHRKKGLKVLGI